MSSASKMKKRRARLSKTERAYRNKLARADAMQRAIEHALAKKSRPGLWARIVKWFGFAK